MDGKGKVLADSEKDPSQMAENPVNRPEVQQARTDKFGVNQQRHGTTIDQDMMYVAMRTDDPAGDVAFVRVALPLTSIQNQLAELGSWSGPRRLSPAWRQWCWPCGWPSALPGR